MAGSFEHITDEDRALAEPREILNSLDTGGDVAECIEQLYGMIWWMANQLAESLDYYDDKPDEERRAGWVELAAVNSQDGLKLSPTERYQEFDEGQYGGMSIKEIIDDYVCVRGDISAPYARRQLTAIIENRIKKAEEARK